MIKITFQKHGCPLVESKVFQTHLEADLFVIHCHAVLSMIKLEEVFH